MLLIEVAQTGLGTSFPAQSECVGDCRTPLCSRITPVERAFLTRSGHRAPFSLPVRGGEKALRRGIVVTISGLAHVRLHSKLFHPLTAIMAGVGASSVSVVDQPGSGLASGERLVQRLQGKPADLFGIGPSNDLARVKVEQHSKIEPTIR